MPNIQSRIEGFVKDLLNKMTLLIKAVSFHIDRAYVNISDFMYKERKGCIYVHIVFRSCRIDGSCSIYKDSVPYLA